MRTLYKILSLIFFALLTLSAQENQSQSIELPDFVITGKQQIDLPTVKKSKAEPIQLISGGIEYPTFTSEKFSLATVTQPQQRIANPFDHGYSYNSQLILGAGQYTLPTGKFFFSKPFSSGIFYANLEGINLRDYTDYSDYNKSAARVGSEFFIDREGEFLPAAIIGLDAKYYRQEYNFFSPFRSTQTPVKREVQNGNIKLSISNGAGEIYKYNFIASGNFLDVKDINSQEIKFHLQSENEFKLNMVSVLLNGRYIRQSFDNSIFRKDFNNYTAGGGLKYSDGSNMLIAGGVNYFSADLENPLTSSTSSDDFMGYWGKLHLKLSNNLGFESHFSRRAMFKTFSDHLENNNWLIPTTLNSFEKYNYEISVAVNFAYKKYYEVSVGAKYFNADNYAYYTSSNSPVQTVTDKFRINQIDDVTGYSVFADALYHLGPFGWFYGDAKYEIVETTNGNLVPYHPKFEINAAYGYKFNFGLSTELSVQYLRDYYEDINNIILLDDYINLSAELRYSLSSNFDLTLQLNNLLNRDNSRWVGYKTPPLDFIGGIDFRF